MVPKMKYYLLVGKLTVFFYCLSQIPGIISLRNVFISMPDAVKKSEKIRMVCKYDLEGETLYTLKWYKQEQEFFRYTPKDTNPTKFFPIKSLPALDIVKDESYGDQVTIKKASLDIAGRFLCEVTTDIPSFHALSGHGELRVAVLPPDFQVLPIIKCQKQKIKVGEWVNVTCVSPWTIPTANLTWTIHNRPISSPHRISLSTKMIIENVTTVDNINAYKTEYLEESTSILSFEVTDKHIKEDNSIKVRCTASIYSLYQAVSEISILPLRSKTIYKPQEGSDPFVLNASPDVKFSNTNSASGNFIDSVFSSRNNNNNNVDEPENLENTNESYRTITWASIYIIPVAIMTRLLC